MNQYVWSYTAKLSPSGSFKGRVLASSLTEAKHKVMNDNLFCKSVDAVLVKNQAAALKQKIDIS
ncbi:hypothetical protein [uncultured Acinetobacter sp.]|uniref:hypothetical protein n=1 Tax=uncultured Acinetobacter sp. TaxID=165433 RepID=UPI0037481F9A